MVGAGAGSDVAEAQIEVTAEADRIADDIWWKSVAFAGIHTRILAISESLLGSAL